VGAVSRTERSTKKEKKKKMARDERRWRKFIELESKENGKVS
jgi:hypothetical protein